VASTSGKPRGRSMTSLNNGWLISEAPLHLSAITPKEGTGKSVLSIHDLSKQDSCTYAVELGIDLLLIQIKLLLLMLILKTFLYFRIGSMGTAFSKKISFLS
jgi:hypothetical protein